MLYYAMGTALVSRDELVATTRDLNALAAAVNEQRSHAVTFGTGVADTANLLPPPDVVLQRGDFCPHRVRDGTHDQAATRVHRRPATQVLLPSSKRHDRHVSIEGFATYTGAPLAVNMLKKSVRLGRMAIGTRSPRYKYGCRRGTSSDMKLAFTSSSVSGSFLLALGYHSPVQFERGQASIASSQTSVTMKPG